MSRPTPPCQNHGATEHTGSALVTPGGPDNKDSDSYAANLVQTWIIMEFCDRGSLQVR